MIKEKVHVCILHASGGKLAFFAFFDLNYGSEQGTIMVEFRKWEEEEKLYVPTKRCPIL
jgi:hypothetical protein